MAEQLRPDNPMYDTEDPAPPTNDRGTRQFFDDVRAIVVDHWSGLPEHRLDEAVWERLDAVLFDDEGISRVEPDFEAKP